MAHLSRPDRDEGGFAALRLSRPAEHRHRLQTQLHRCDQLAEGEPAVDDAVVFELRTDGRGPGSVAA